MHKITGIQTGGKSQKILIAISGLIIVAYFLLCFTPLRLHVDMIRYFAIKDCMEYGCPPDSFAANDYLPYGYTFLLLSLSKLGILNSFVIVLINCIFFFASLYLLAKIFAAPSFNTPLFFIVSMLSWVCIKFTAHPLSEMMYMFFSVLSIYLFHRYTLTGSFLLLLLGFVSGTLAFITRSVGVSLIGALLLGLVWQYRKQLLAFFSRNKLMIILCLAVAACAVIFSKQLGIDHYTGVLTKQFDEGRGFIDLIEWHFTEWAETGLNLSASKLLPFLPESAGKIILVVTGVLFFGLFVFLAFLKKNSTPSIVKIYLVLYILLMFNWPFYDPRFWVPVMPIILAVVLNSGIAKTSLLRKAVLYPLAAFYLLAGISSLGYMLYTSFDKKTMAKTQANGVYRNEYEKVFYGRPQTDTAQKIDPFIESIIRRYN